MINMILFPAMGYSEIRKHFSCKCGCGFNAVDFEIADIFTEIAAELIFDETDDDFFVDIIVGTSCLNTKVSHRNYHMGKRVKFKVSDKDKNPLDPKKMVERFRKLDIPIAMQDDCLVIDVTRRKKK